jgi:glycosyltransferase involved in cell wall biosynthesis
VAEESPYCPRVSVVIPVGSRHAEPKCLHAEYKTSLDRLAVDYELIFVLDGARSGFANGLRTLLDDGERFTVISLSRSFGEATAIMAGFEHATGEVILTLPAYHQIEAEDISKILGGLDVADVCIGHRWPRAGSPFERLRRSMFHGLLSAVTRLRFRDLGCGARAMNRRVLEEIKLYGDQHRFIAVLADRQGFRTKEVDVRQSPRDRLDRMYRPRDYTRGLLDLFTIFFLVRFTKRPLRFFGMVGVTSFTIGSIAITWMVIERIFFDHGLTERPALLLAALLVVLGLQLFALGLLGELIIFTHAREIKDYQIERVIQFRSPRDAGSATRACSH